MSDIDPKIYVADLAAYNSGVLHGVWIDLAGKSEEEVFEEIHEMLAESKEENAEEFAIHDYEGFGGITIHENESISNVLKIAEALEEHGYALVGYMDVTGDDAEDAASRVEEAFQGVYKNEKEFARDLINSIYGKEYPEFVMSNIDYEMLARDVHSDLDEGEEEDIEQQYGSLENYCREMISENGYSFFRNIEFYIDWDAVASDLMYDYFTWQGPDGLYVYSNL